MKKIKTPFLKILLVSVPLTTVLSCTDSNLSSEIELIYNHLDDLVFELQSKKITVFGEENHELIIPKIEYISEHQKTLFSGATMISHDFWNFNPTKDEINNHLITHSITKSYYFEMLETLNGYLEDAVSLLKSYEPYDGLYKLLEVLENTSIMIEDVDDVSASEFANDLNEMIMKNDLVESAINESSKEVFDVKFEFSWNTKLYGPSPSLKKNLNVWHMVDVLFNLHMQVTYRVIQILHML